MEYVCGKCKVPEKYCCPYLDCVADVWHAAQRAERRKTVRSAVQQRKAEIPPCQDCKGYGVACVQGAFRGSRICARERAKHSAVA